MPDERQELLEHQVYIVAADFHDGLARIDHQLPDENLGLTRCRMRPSDRIVLVARVGKFIVEFQIALDRGQDDVEIMRDATSETTDRRHLLRLCRTHRRSLGCQPVGSTVEDGPREISQEGQTTYDDCKLRRKLPEIRQYVIKYPADHHCDDDDLTDDKVHQRIAAVDKKDENTADQRRPREIQRFVVLNDKDCRQP